MASERVPRPRRTPPTIEHMLDVLGAAAVGNAQARVEVDPDERSHPHEQLGHAINVLLADLGQDVADTRAVLGREEAGRARHEFADLVAAAVGEARELLTSLDATVGMPANVARVPLTRLRTSLDALAAGLDELRELTEIELGRTLLREQPLQLRSLLDGCLRRAGVAEGLLVVAPNVPQTLLGDPLRLSLIVDRMLGSLGAVRRLDASAIPASAGWHVVRIEAAAAPTPDAEPGLRLAIARELAAALGGQLAVDVAAGSATLIAPLAEPSD